MTDENEKEEHIGHKVDKLVVGAIIGGAIGSVVGLTLAPKKGKTTRKEIVDKSRKFLDSHQKEINTAKRLTKETARGLFRLIKNAIKKR